MIAERLKAQQELRENPFSIQAKTKLKELDDEIKTWSKTGVKPEQFTGEKTKNILRKEGLEGGYMAWARKVGFRIYEFRYFFNFQLCFFDQLTMSLSKVLDTSQLMNIIIYVSRKVRLGTWICVLINRENRIGLVGTRIWTKVLNFPEVISMTTVL